MPAKHILVIDDEEGMRSSLHLALRCAGYTVSAVENGQQALMSIGASKDDATPVDLALVDYGLRGMTGLDLIGDLRDVGVDFPIVLMSGVQEQEIFPEPGDRACEGFLKKPFQIKEMLAKVDSILNTKACTSTAE